ncbi:MAG: LLM class flavin-dependent oxidoreductase [Salinirussus sp.]
MDRGIVLPTVIELADRRELIADAGDLGIDALFIGESANSNLFVDLTEAALRSDEIRLGVAIANVYSRSPSLIALGAAHLDAVSGGRLTLGLGTSTPELIEGVHGLPFDRPVGRIAEYVDLIRAGLSGETLDYDGDFYSPSGGRLRQPPAQDNLPIAIAAVGPANRRVAGRKADVWLPHLIPRSRFDEASRDVFDAAKEAGRSSDDIEVAVYVPTAVDEDLEAARDRIRRHIAAYAGSATPYRNAIENAGYSEAATRLYDAWQNGERAAARAAVTDEMVHDFGLATTPDDAGAAIAEWADAGLDTLLMHFPPGTEPAEVRRAARAV